MVAPGCAGGLVSLVQTLGIIVVINRCCVGQIKVYDDDSSAGLCGAAECECKNKSDPNLKCTVEEMENHNNYCHDKNISQ